MAKEWGVRPWDLEREIEKDPSLDLWIERKALWDGALSNRKEPEEKTKEYESVSGNRRKKKTVIR